MSGLPNPWPKMVMCASGCQFDYSQELRGLVETCKPRDVLIGLRRRAPDGVLKLHHMLHDTENGSRPYISPEAAARIIGVQWDNSLNAGNKTMTREKPHHVKISLRGTSRILQCGCFYPTQQLALVYGQVLGDSAPGKKLPVADWSLCVSLS